MHRVHSLPAYLLERYNEWKANVRPEKLDWFRKLAIEGQNPRAMVIACCDSRLEINSIFGQRTGELFIHRNIANLVPPFTPDGNHHGTGAAVEFAVKHLKVKHILVMGHSQCGGVAGCISMCEGTAPEFEKPESLIGRWLDVLRPGYDAIADVTDPDSRQTALEKEGIHVSLQNLLSYPYVKEAVDAGEVSLHGLWAHIDDMEFETVDGSGRSFVPL
ncbi:carbonic anhydrase [Gymnodinialimonas ceratoperidinii]|uniref:Carbonic anhydrase n=1 Tax=Gymnodinialimonas ceratoperidinii TaxID=2856823 RepID=A0A8F6TXX8_9RHOB|nr:carbonic anhydrase [Gymnodinialimonas ceratoperidinii]QXT39963.1 carbonic anhydrase [Gymnodinialimonas ceratoperidinii]